ncbi:MAG TPA: GNVR domain-containing protein [Pyrinomonadaceae bacterium]|jgi:polysaccharide chain length determinant protein (PEP-CTERM system associated)
MSVEFRQRKPAEYARILWRRKWLIVLPAIAVSFAVAIVVWRLPNVYESKTLLVVKPASVAQGLMPKLSDDDLSIRINNISQEVFSRSTLEPLIINYGLYAAERRRGEPMDTLVERMRKKDVSIELNKSRNDITNGFNLTLRGPDPVIVQKVTSELASKYVNAQLESVRSEVDTTKKLIDEQVNQAQEELAQIEKRQLEVKLQNIGTLPAQQQTMASTLSGLHEEQKARIAEVGRLRDQLAAYNSQLGDLQKQIEQEKERIVDTVTDPKTTMSWAELTKSELVYEAQLQDLLTKLKPKNPEVISVQQQLEGIKRSKQQLIDAREAEIAEKQKKLAGWIDPRTNTIKTNIELAKGELARQENLLAQTNTQIAQLQQNLGRVPGTEIALQGLENEYRSKKTYYDELVQKQHQLELSSAVAQKQQGEQIAVIDPASLREEPVAPKRPLLIALGLALGIVFGFLCAAAFEVPRLLTIQTVEDARHYTSLPVLASVPELLTPREERRRRLRRLGFACAGIAVTILSIPALALFLKLTHLFEMFST